MDIIVQCCVCKKILKNGEWVEMEVSKGTSVSHTYCPPCLNRAIKEIKEERASARVSEN